METIHNTIILAILLATTTTAGIGIWYASVWIKNYIYAFGRSLTFNEKSYIFESGNQKEEQ